MESYEKTVIFLIFIPVLQSPRSNNTYEKNWKIGAFIPSMNMRLFCIYGQMLEFPLVDKGNITRGKNIASTKNGSPPIISIFTHSQKNG